MTVRPHPEYMLLRARCRAFRTLGTPLECEVVRYAPLAFAKPVDQLSGQGSFRRGGRFNARDSFLTVYASLDPHTATAEIDGGYARYEWASRAIPESSKHPQVRVVIHFQLQRVLDLCDAAVRRKMEVTLADLRGNWRKPQNHGEEAFTQALGRAARTAGFEALLAPSRHRGINLIWFPGRSRAGSEVRILHEDDLRDYLK